MQQERWDRLEAAFAAAVDLDPPARAAALDRVCEGDAGLRMEVERMLAAAAAGPGALHDVVSGASLPDGSDPAIGRMFGAYRVTRLLGRGGMGAVYEGERDDQAFTRHVAIKILRSEYVEGSAATARFRQERQILAALDHPNIARLLDGGEFPAPYLVMEKVAGPTLSEFAARLKPRGKLELFLRVCCAVQFAHARLIVHRDLKPSNILVTAEGEPKLLDFGIAKLLTEERPDLTGTGLRMFTPGYASPEQFRREAISTASDVYSLGAVLYELLAGRPPHDTSELSAAEAERVVNSVEPPLPSTVAPPEFRSAIAGDLDNIARMALRKEPSRRYASAEALAADIRRHLDGHPVAARPDTILYRGSRFVRRNRAAMAAALVVAASLVTGAAAAMYQARIARDRYREVRQLANRFLFQFDESIRNLPGATRSREMLVGTALEYLDRLSGQAGDDAELLGELAVAYSKIADVQGNPGQPNLGRADDALANYARSESLWERVLAATPRHAAALRGLALARLSAGDIYRVRRDREKAVRLYESGAQSANAAVGAAPSDAEVIFVAAGAWLRLGDANLDWDEPQQARTAFQKSFDMYRRALQVRGSDRDRNAVAILLARLAMVSRAEEQLDEARTYHEQSLAIREELAKRNPDSVAIQRGLANELNNIGSVSFSTQSLSRNDHATAESAFRRALEIHQRLAALDPADRTAQVDITLLNMRLCETLAASRPAEAAPFCDASIMAGLKVYAATGHKDSRDYVALSELGKADAELRLKHWTAALHSAESGWSRFEEAGPGMKMNYALNCARAGLLIADAWSALGDRARAASALRKAKEMTKDVDRGTASKFLLAKLAEVDRRLQAAPEYTQRK